MSGRHVALVSEHASPLATLGGVDCGGQNVYVAHLARELAARGHRVDVFTRRDRADVPTIVRWEHGIRVVHVDAGPPAFVPKERLLPYMGEFARWMLDFADASSTRWDLLHANFWMSALVAERIHDAIGTPFVVTFHALGRVRRLHQGGADGFPEERGALEERVARRADAVIAECPADADDLAALYGVPRSRMELIPCGVDTASFAPLDRAEARRRLGLAAEGPVLLQLGRMVPRKGVDDAIRASARLRDAHGIEARLLVVGGDEEVPDERRTPELRRLREVAEGEGIADRVSFVGRRGGEALRLHYCAADLFFTLPWYEPFGITPLEAMACGTPVIGARVGGIQYSVVDGETGVLVPPHDPEAAARAAARLLGDDALRARMGVAAIRRVRTSFTWRSVARQVERLYLRVLEERVRATRPVAIPAPPALAGTARGHGVTPREARP